MYDLECLDFSLSLNMYLHVNIHTQMDQVVVN